MSDLEAAFRRDIDHIYNEANRAIRYRPTYLIQMVNELGAVEAARRLVLREEPSEGFTKLLLGERLDLTVEAVVLKPEYHALFTLEVRDRARQRLLEAHYTPPWLKEGAQSNSQPVGETLTNQATNLSQQNSADGDDALSDEIAEPSAAEPQIVFAAWLDSVRSATQNALVARLAEEYPAWLEQTFGERVQFVPYTGQRFGLILDGRRRQWGRFNTKRGVSIWLTDVTAGPVFDLLQTQLSNPTLFTRLSWGCRFVVLTDGDVQVLHNSMQLVANTGKESADDRIDDDDEETPSGEIRPLSEWQAQIETAHPLVRQLVSEYPAWLHQTFGERVTFRPLEKQRFDVLLDGRRQQRGRFNQVDGIYIWLRELSDEEVEWLRDKLSAPHTLSLRTRNGIRGQRFIVNTRTDYTLLQQVTERQLHTASAAQVMVPVIEPAPDHLHDESEVDEDAPDVAVTPNQSPHETYERWLANLQTNSDFVRETATSYPRWVRETFGDRAELQFYNGRGMLVTVGDRSPISCWFNPARGVYVWLPEPHEQDVALLKSRLYSPGSVKPRAFDGVPGYRFLVLTAEDVTVLHELTQRIVERLSVEWPPRQRDSSSPVFVLIHSADTPFQTYGQTYSFTNYAGGAHKQLSTAAISSQQDGLPVYLVIYRPQPHYAFTAWARVTDVVQQPGERQDEIRTTLTLEQHEFPVPLGLKSNATALTGQLSWLAQGLAVAFRGKSIRPVTSTDYDTIIEAARATSPTMSLNDVVFAVLSRARGQGLSLRDIVAQAQLTGLITRTVTDSELLNVLTADRRYQQQGAQQWVLRDGDLYFPEHWTQLALIRDSIRSLDDRSYSGEALFEQMPVAIRGTMEASAFVEQLRRLRLLTRTIDQRYQRQSYVSGEPHAVLRLMVLGMLLPTGTSQTDFMLPATTIVLQLATTEPHPVDEFAPFIEADTTQLLSWYEEAGFVQRDEETWRANDDALELLSGDDGASVAYNALLTTLREHRSLAVTDLPPADGPLPPVLDFAERLRQMSRELFIDERIVRRIYRSLMAGRHVVLSGPPGTGKTELARRLPSLLWHEPVRQIRLLSLDLDTPPTVERQVERHGYAAIVVTATEDWGVRDVVGGIGPQLDTDHGLTYTIQHGILTRTVLHHYEGTEGGQRLPVGTVLTRRDYQHEDGRRYRGAWLVIDEFTRAPIDAAFGSLLTTLSGGDSARLAVPTPQGGLRDIPVPADFRIIGTLNSFDRHFLNQMSEALKRRFDFIDVLPPSPRYAPQEQGVAAVQALRRLRANGFTQIGIAGDPPSYQWEGVVAVRPTTGADGAFSYELITEHPAARAAVESFWRIFSVLRIFRQFGTAQVVAIYTNLFAGVLVGFPWDEALDTALADSLADQLQVLSRDEQHLIDAYLTHAGAADPNMFVAAVREVLRSMPMGRVPALLQALHEADVAINEKSDIATTDEKQLRDEQLIRLFAPANPLELPTESLFRRRLRSLMSERGL